MEGIIKKVCLNSYWYFLPILAFNIFFASKLTEVGYMTKEVDVGLLASVELILRVAVFALPLMIYLPELSITRTWWIQLGPVYLPIIWLVAIALMGRSRWFILVSSVFVVVHTLSTYYRLRG